MPLAVQRPVSPVPVIPPSLPIYFLRRMKPDDISHETRQAMRVEGAGEVDMVAAMLFVSHIGTAADEDELLRLCLKSAEDLMDVPRESTVMTPEMERRRKGLFMAMLLAKDRLRKVLETPRTQRTYGQRNV